MSKIYRSVGDIVSIIPSNKKVVLVGGCFDLFHIAHLDLLMHSKKLGDILVVAVLSDDYIKSYKGVNRPILNQEERSALLEGLSCVDYIFISDTSSSDDSILSILNPHKIVFGIEEGHDSIKKTLSRRDRIKSRFPNIEFCSVERFSKTISTSIIIERIKNTS